MDSLFNNLLDLVLLRRRPSEREVLGLVNRARTSLGLPQLASLPEGTQARGRSCPLSYALGGLVGSDGLCVSDGWQARQLAEAWSVPVTPAGNRYIVRLPRALERFVLAFDRGAYPSLLAPAHVA